MVVQIYPIYFNVVYFVFQFLLSEKLRMCVFVANIKCCLREEERKSGRKRWENGYENNQIAVLQKVVGWLPAGTGIQKALRFFHPESRGKKRGLFAVFMKNTTDAYFLLSAKKFLTSSFATISVLKAYAPVLSDFTILMHLVKFLPEPVFSVATTFFAMVAFI